MVIARISPDLMQKLDGLRAHVVSGGRVAVAYSGGVDSALVYAVAHQALAGGAVAVTAVSPSLARHELDESRRIINELGGRQVLIESHEVEDPRYGENDLLRCYFCKNEVYTRLVEWSRENGFDVVVDGTNVDDTADQRPGRKAARELGIRSPLLEAGLTKAEVRALARHLGLRCWDKPAMACLSSRIPYGTAVTVERLSQVEEAENAIRGIGLRHFRVRHHGDVARIEVAPADFPLVLASRDRLLAEMRQLGFTYVSLDLDGYRQGSMNEKAPQPRGHDTPPHPAG